MAAKLKNLVAFICERAKQNELPETVAENYLQLGSLFQENSSKTYSKEIQNNVSNIIQRIQTDIECNHVQVISGALQFLGCLLHEEIVIQKINRNESEKIVQCLSSLAKNSEDKTVCTRAMWCLSKQKIDADIFMSMFEKVLETLKVVIEKWKGQSVTVEFETLNVIKRLLEQHQEEMLNRVSEWGQFVLSCTVHSALKIRQTSLELIEGNIGILLHHNDFVDVLVTVINNKTIGNEMVKLYGSGEEIYVLKLWGMIVQLLTRKLHHGDFINQLLPIVEKSFTTNKSAVKIAAYQSWQCLIDNFAMDLAILTNPKRVKLVMQVFKLNNAKDESVAAMKFNVWWHYVWLLGSKLYVFFDQVFVPLMNFCIGGMKSNNSALTATPRSGKSVSSPATPQLNLPLRASNTQQPVFKFLQNKALEVLALVLGPVSTNFSRNIPKFSLDKLNHEVITSPNFFVKHANLFITTFSELIFSLKTEMSEDLMLCTWHCLLNQLSSAAEVLKGETRDIFSCLLTTFQVIVLSNTLPTNLLLKMFGELCNLPRKILCSTAYNISNGEQIHGTPALFLTELLLTPVLLKTATSLESYMSHFHTLIDIGVGNASTLGYCETTLKILECNLTFVEKEETQWRLWSCVAQPLYEYIIKGNEVNQGDALESNFGCMYSVLMLPIQQKFAASLPLTSCKTMTKTWCDIYKAFARQAALVNNVQENETCEEICQKWLKIWKKEDYYDGGILDFSIQALSTIVNEIDYSSLKADSTFNIKVSPSKWMKRKSRPMGNIGGLINLINHTIMGILDQEVLAQSSSVICLLETLSTLVNNVQTSGILISMLSLLASALGGIFDPLLHKKCPKVFTAAVISKMEKLWQEITTSVMSHYSGPKDSELLEKLAPVLASTFPHPKRNIKNNTVAFWQNTFGKLESLRYPPELKPIIRKVKEKTVLSLPDWNNIELDVVEETPSSLISQGDSQVPEPNIPGMPSPRRIHGSLLNKSVSPSPKKSPKRSPAGSKSKAQVKRDILGANLTNEGFVVIKSPPRKKRILTEHQKEVFREKKNIPAMYNNLDTTQDGSIMSQFNNDTQMSQSQMQPSQELPASQGFSSIVSEIESIPNSEIDMDLPASVSLLKSDPNIGAKETQTAKPCTRSKRKRSVQFKEDVEKTKMAVTGNDEDKPKSIEHFSVIQQVISSSSSQNEDSSCKSSGEGSKDNFCPNNVSENQQGAIGISLESSKSEKSTSDLGQSNLDKQEDMECEDVIPSSQDFSTSSVNKASFLLSPRRLKSPRNLRSSQSPQHAVKETRLQKRSRSFDVNGQSRLDGWVMKSPTKISSSQDTISEYSKDRLFKNLDDNSNVENTYSSVVAAAVTIVEETQSPDKLSRIKNKAIKEFNNSLTPVQETPPKKVGDVPDSHKRMSNRKLFADSNQNGNFTPEDSNLIPASPPPKSSKNSLFSSPVIKLKKLTDVDIKTLGHTSPSKNEELCENKNEIIKSDDKEKDAVLATLSNDHMDTCVNQYEGLSNITPNQPVSDNIGESVELDIDNFHPQDDFSSIRPLDSDCALLDSQGFETGSLKTQGKEIDSSESVSVSDHQTNSGNEKITNNADGLVNPEIEVANTMDLFSGNMDMSESSQNTLIKEEDDRKTQVSNNSENVSQDLGTQNCVPELESAHDVEAYDPTESSTLRLTPERERKRKQPTPKKVSPLSLRPKRQCRVDSAKKKKDMSNKKSSKLGQKSEDPKSDEKPENVTSISVSSEISKNCDISTTISGDSEGKQLKKEDKETHDHLTRENSVTNEQEEQHDSSDKDVILKTSEDVPDSACFHLEPDIIIINDKEQTKSTKHRKAKKRADTPRRRSLREKNSQKELVLSTIDSEDSEELKKDSVFKAKDEDDGDDDKTLTVIKERQRSNDSEDDLPLSQLKNANKPKSIGITPVEEDKETVEVASDNQDLRLTTHEEKGKETTSSCESDDDVPLLKLTDKKSQTAECVSSEVDCQQPVLDSNNTGTPNNSPAIVEPSDSGKKQRGRPKKSLRFSLQSRGASMIAASLLQQEKNESVNNTVNSENTDDDIERNGKIHVDENCQSLSSENGVEASSSTGKGPLLDETPRKDRIGINPAYLFESQSDSKLVMASRRFDKTNRPVVVARRSILKNSPSGGGQSVAMSPSTRQRIRPIQLAGKCSPSASPSAGILKRRRLSGEKATNSPSPPSKQRRVNFAEPLADFSDGSRTADVVRQEGLRPPSPLVLETQFNKESEDSEMSAGSSDIASTPFYSSTQECELSSTQPIYPELVDCCEKVDRVLPLLTTSMWIRGLGQLLRSKNIHTIGDLSRLTEREVDSLPIRSPKVQTVKEVLKKFDVPKAETKKVTTEPELSVPAENETEKLPTDDTSTTESDSNVPLSEKVDTDNFGNLLKSVVGSCHQMTTEEVFKLHQQLSQMTNDVVAVLKSRCQSSTPN